MNGLIPQFGFSSWEQAFATLVTAAFSLTAITALFYLMWGGIRYITSGGDDAKTRGARATIINAIVGLVLLALAPLLWETVIALILPELRSQYGF